MRRRRARRFASATSACSVNGSLWICATMWSYYA
jgi:hypothetical protein